MAGDLRVVALVGDADNSVTGADGEENFSGAGQERDDARRRAHEAARCSTVRRGRKSRSSDTISIAATAASAPLFPCLPPARSVACSMVSTVSTPNVAGTPVAACTDAIPD